MRVRHRVPRSSRAAVALLAGAALAVALTGCDRKLTSDQKAAVATVKGFTKALAADDPARACALMSPAGQRALVESIGLGRVRTCAAAVHQASIDLSSQVRDAFRSGIDVQGITIQGDRATVLPVDIAAVRLERIGGAWRIARFD